MTRSSSRTITLAPEGSVSLAAAGPIPIGTVAGKLGSVSWSSASSAVETLDHYETTHVEKEGHTMWEVKRTPSAAASRALRSSFSIVKVFEAEWLWQGDQNVAMFDIAVGATCSPKSKECTKRHHAMMQFLVQCRFAAEDAPQNQLALPLPQNTITELETYDVTQKYGIFDGDNVLAFIEVNGDTFVKRCYKKQKVDTDWVRGAVRSLLHHCVFVSKQKAVIDWRLQLDDSFLSLGRELLRTVVFKQPKSIGELKANIEDWCQGCKTDHPCRVWVTMTDLTKKLEGKLSGVACANVPRTTHIQTAGDRWLSWGRTYFYHVRDNFTCVCGDSD